MAGPLVRDLMTPNPMCCTPQTPIPEAARMMVECDCGSLPVVEDFQNNRLLGMVTDRDIVCRIIARDLEASQCIVQQAMTEAVAHVEPEASLDDCVRLMCEHQVRRIPICNADGQVVGIIAQADLARASAGQPDLEEELIEMVEEVSEPAPFARGV